MILCCFNRNIGSKINNLQKNLQTVEFTSQLENKEQIKKLNKLESQAWLYSEVIQILSVNTSESHQRIAKTIEALEQKRSEILEELEPRRLEKYQIIVRIKNFYQSIFLSQAEKDYRKIEEIINKLNNYINNSQASEEIFEDLFNRLIRYREQNAKYISPYRLRLLYKIEDLIKNSYLKYITELEDDEGEQKSHNLREELRSQIKTIAEQFNKLLEDNHQKVNELEFQSQNIHRANNIINDLRLEKVSLRQELDNLISVNRTNQNQIEKLNQNLKKAITRQSELQSQREMGERRLQQVSEDNRRKQKEIEQLNDQIYNQSQEKPRKLSGKYIGNLSNKESKFHFNESCRDWKSLALEYMMYDDETRDIKCSSSPQIFKNAGLEECSNCNKS
ncbi:MAG: hypothetical protein WBA39_31905 [Rivularia sp. (in: cyanobacteria)]